MRYVIPRERDGSLSTSSVIRYEDDGAQFTIQLRAATADAVAYTKWRAEGGVPDEAPAPAAAPVEQPISWLDFMALFTPAEQQAIAVSVNPYVAVFRMMATGLGGDLNMADPRVAQGLDALVAAGLLAAARKADVLARRAP